MQLAINIDCLDKDRAAEFWCAVLGYERSGNAGQYCAIRPPRGNDGPKLVFQQVEDPKLVKNRVHLDLDYASHDEHDREVARIAALGATVVAGPIDEFGEHWTVLADPDGNEFCVVAKA